MNVCSYHLQEAGATPVQELAYCLATAIGVLDAVQESGQVDDDRFPQVFASISFFVNAGIRFVEETCKMRAFTAAVGPHRPRALRRHRPEGPPLPLRRAGEQPRASPRPSPRTTCSASCSRCSASRCRSDARARSIQLPAWNEALGLPRPWDQQWSLRMQQVLAYETDLLEYADIFDGSHVDRGHDRRAGRRGVGRARRRARARRRVRGHRRAEGPARRAATPSACAASSPATSRSSASTGSPRRLPSPLEGEELDPQGRPRASRRRLVADVQRVARRAATTTP